MTDEQQHAWRRFVEVLVLVPAALEAQLQRDAGLTHMGYIVLFTLSERPDRQLPMSRLAKLVSASLSRLSHVVDRLEKRGWVRRTPDETDGRYTLAILTDEGWAKIVDSAPGHVEAVRTLVFDPLTAAQRRQLRDIGHRIRTAIDADASCPDGSAP